MAVVVLQAPLEEAEALHVDARSSSVAADCCTDAVMVVHLVVLAGKADDIARGARAGAVAAAGTASSCCVRRLGHRRLLQVRAAFSIALAVVSRNF